MVCRDCGGAVESEYPFCPWCAAAQVRKAVALFPPHPEVDAPGRGLRVSRYFAPDEGPPHTRLSVYDEDGKVSCVVALDDEQTVRLAVFLSSLAPSPVPIRSGDALHRLIGRLMPRR